MNDLGIACDFAFRPSLYLAGDKLDAVDLQEEHSLRGHLGIAGACLDAGGLRRAGSWGRALCSIDGSAEVDPVKLTRGLLSAALRRGALLVCPATARFTRPCRIA